MYEWLGARGVASVVRGAYGYGASADEHARCCAGRARQVGYHDVGEGLDELAAALAALPAPAYGFAYIDTIDSLMHKVGPDAHALIDAEVTGLLDAIEQRLCTRCPRERSCCSRPTTGWRPCRRSRRPT